uniref:Leucine-rich repeat-containing protein DDB_G0290503 isoform X1 n=1 Tax=Dermatophagoides pteronyssinus TaxID=6956 RepID=A0A6P6XM27_DERPT|nr:putative leucine-rich repeat-containing protein DDB_G0290503 isoform X1 [Dermatophagoides pteronyssinus]
MMSNPKKPCAIPLNNDAENLKVTSIVDKNNHGSSNHSIHRKNYPLRIDTINRTKLDTSYDSIMNELIPYPFSCISTIIEKVNKDGTTINPNNVELTTKKRYRKKRNSLHKQPSQSTISQSSHDTVDGESIASISSFCHNNLASHEIENSQNSSFNNNQSFDQLDISNIVKRLCEKSDQSTQTNPVISMVEKCNQYVQANIPLNSGDTIRIEQQQSNQALRNQINQLTYIIEEMSKERSNRDLHMHQLQKQLIMMEKRIKEFENEKQQQLNNEQSELRKTPVVTKTDETIMVAYQQEISIIKLENEQLKQRLNEMIAIQHENSKLINQKDDIINNMTIHMNAYQQENNRLNNELSRYNQQPIDKIEIDDNNRKIPYEQMKDNVMVIHEKHEGFKLKKDAILLFKHRLYSIQNDCRLLQQQLNELRTTAVNNNKIFVEKLLTEQLSNTLMLQFNEIKSETSRLKRLNEQLLQEKLHEKDRNIQLNCEFQSCLSHLRNENEHLKQMNIGLENKSKTFQNQMDELRQEYDNSLGQINECNHTIKELYDKITNYEIGKQRELEIQQEIFELKELVVKMEESNQTLKSKHEQLLLQCEKYTSEINENRTDIERLTKQNLALHEENEKYRKKIDSVPQQSDDNIINDRNINAISPQDDLHTTTVHYDYHRNNNDNDDDYNINDDIKQVIMQKESIIREQDIKLIELGKQIECLCCERSELENRINQSIQSSQLKEMEIKRLNMAMNDHNNGNQQIDQRILLLETELAKEKERSKGLSLALAKEKLQSSSSKNLVENLSHQQQQTSVSNENLEHSSPQQQQQQQKPLIKLHSSVNELKKEFQNFKIIFQQTYNHHQSS